MSATFIKVTVVDSEVGYATFGGRIRADLITYYLGTQIFDDDDNEVAVTQVHLQGEQWPIFVAESPDEIDALIAATSWATRPH